MQFPSLYPSCRARRVMIPIGLPSLEFVLIRLAFLLLTLLWLGWTLRLGASAAARQSLGGTWGIAYLLMSGLSLFTLWRIYDLQSQFTAYRTQQLASFHPVLSQAMRLGAIEMPQGTALDLSEADQLGSFRAARFPSVILIAGVETLALTRYLSVQTDAAYRTTGYTPQRLYLSGRGESLQQGWICDATQPIAFDTQADGSIMAFTGCVLAQGNHIEAIPAPAGSEVLATEGTLYLDGSIDPDRWLIHLPETAEFDSGRAVQHGGAILLDADRKIFRQVY